MDGIELYTRSEQDTSLIHTTRTYNNDIGMSFKQEKCSRKATKTLRIAIRTLKSHNQLVKLPGKLHIVAHLQRISPKTIWAINNYACQSSDSLLGYYAHQRRKKPLISKKKGLALHQGFNLKSSTLRLYIKYRKTEKDY